jgi:hypothetical protein
VADSPTAALFESLHAGVTLAQVCEGSGQDFWSFGPADHQMLPRAAKHMALKLLSLPLRLPTDRGSLETLETYGLTFYHAIDMLPEIYDKTR